MSNLQKSNASISISQIGDNLTKEGIKPYDVRISRDRPACFVFLIDQSGSMGDNWGLDNSKTMADLVALYVNNALNEIINISQKTESEPRPYFNICVIGYGQNSNEAQILWEGELADEIFVTPADLKNNPTGNGEIEVKRKTFKGETLVKISVAYWFSPMAESLTPMGAAFDLCTDVLNDWTDKHQNCFPPIVLNITDGAQTDCDNDEMLIKAYNLKQTKTLYGQTLLFNLHISSLEADSVVFPEQESDLPADKQCQLLYNMSSNLPEIFKRRIAAEVKKKDYTASTQYVAMTFQGSVGDLTKCLDIGTKTVQTS